MPRTEDFHRFNLSEHAGLCTAGAPLIGASIVACYATASFAAGGNASSCQGYIEDTDTPNTFRKLEF